MSASVKYNTSDMALENSKARSGNSTVCECLEGYSCSMCLAVGSKARDGSDITTALVEAVSKIEKLIKEMSSLKQRFNVQNVRLQKLEVSNNEGSESEEGSSASNSSKRIKQIRSNKAKYKKARVENLEASSQCEESPSEDELGLRALDKRLECKQRASSDLKRQSRLRQAKYVSTSEDNSASGGSETSGSDSEVKKKHRRRRKVKSGAKVKKRPVIQTELWPHTIANEDDGEDISSEDISLTKFLTCYTYILISCVKAAEAVGRSSLLHAISTVLECLPWTEARAFHNIIMIKIEQGRIKWSADFSALAGQFLDKKVRLSLRQKGSSVGASSSNSTSGRSYDKDFENSSFKYNSNFNPSRNKALHYVICNQWNSGECSYGIRCKRWHVCRSCALDGKLGEPHKASSHDSSAARGRQSDQRV